VRVVAGVEIVKVAVVASRFVKKVFCGCGFGLGFCVSTKSGFPDEFVPLIFSCLVV
jgi:hypothetical protein